MISCAFKCLAETSFVICREAFVHWSLCLFENCVCVTIQLFFCSSVVFLTYGWNLLHPLRLYACFTERSLALPRAFLWYLHVQTYLGGGSIGIIYCLFYLSMNNLNVNWKVYISSLLRKTQVLNFYWKMCFLHSWHTCLIYASLCKVFLCIWSISALSSQFQSIITFEVLCSSLGLIVTTISFVLMQLILFMQFLILCSLC